MNATVVGLVTPHAGDADLARQAEGGERGRTCAMRWRGRWTRWPPLHNAREPMEAYRQGRGRGAGGGRFRTVYAAACVGGNDAARDPKLRD